jgi:Cu(I)/Ag(I) efflux system periplasmic protein CusF
VTSKQLPGWRLHAGHHAKEFFMRAIPILVVAIATLGAAGACAQQTSQASAHADHHAVNVAAAAAPQSQGEVRKVDLAQGKVTLRHGPLVNLDMPAMTMVFTATDRQLLQGLKVGDKVRFHAESRDGILIVTALEVVR